MPVLTRLAGIVENRVRAFGVDPDTIEPSPDGHDLEPECPPSPEEPAPPKDDHHHTCPGETHPRACRCLKCHPSPALEKLSWVLPWSLGLILLALIIIIVILLV